MRKQAEPITRPSSHDFRWIGLGLENRCHSAKHACGVHADRIDANLRQVTRDLRIIGGSFSADANVSSVALGADHSLSEHFQHSRITFIKIEGDNVRIPV